jgi:phosphate transport system substrate-binding protein
MLRWTSAGRLTVIAAVATAIAVACGGSPSTSGTDVGKGSLTGAGSTFIAPFFQKAFFDYNVKYPDVSVNYQAVGSGAGIQQFTAKTVDFGATDVPMGSSDISSAGGDSTLTQIPTVLGAVAVAFNVKGVDKLNLDSDTLAAIFLGHVKNWNDPKIAALNPGVTFPNKAITVEHRSDGSGTTFIFTDYLSKVSDEWKTKVGNAKSVQWPVGVGGSGNQAVAQGVTSTDGAIGYVELAYVVQTNMKMAAIKNAAGNFLQASVQGASAAAAQVSNLSATNFSIVNQPGADSYPIAGFTWTILRTSYSDASKGKAVVNLFKWIVTDGQSDGTSLQYAPLPAPVQQLALDNLKAIKAGGQPVLGS